METESAKSGADGSRSAALLKRLALGESLSVEQREEVARLFGAETKNEARAAKRVTSAKYPQTLSHYATALGIEGKHATRKLKRWIAKGRAASPPDFPPFEEPGKLASWWRRVMDHKPPDYLLEIEATQQGGEEKASDPKPTQKEDEKGEPTELDLDADTESDLGLRQIRALVKVTFEKLEKALALGNVTQAASLRREWLALVGTLRQWEKDITKIQEGKGEVLRTRVINTEVTRIFTVLSQSFRNALFRLAEEYRPEIPKAERRKRCLELRDQCFEHVKSSRFASVFPEGLEHE